MDSKTIPEPQFIAGQAVFWRDNVTCEIVSSVITRCFYPFIAEIPSWRYELEKFGNHPFKENELFLSAVEAFKFGGQ